MTLIARINFRGVPLYIGDLLISRKGKTAEKVDIPASTDINAKLPADAARSVTGLQQKINIIDDRLIISWAGSLLQARALIRDIRAAVEQGASSFEDIGEVVENVPMTDRNELSLIGTILTPDVEQPGGIHLSHFNYCADRLVLDDVVVRAAGTGADDLFELLPQMVASNPPPNCDRESEQFFRWIAGQGYMLAASFIGYETSTGQNLLDWWGGAFEVATLTGGKFQKISNVLHTIWRAVRVDQKKYEIQLSPKFIKYDYFNDALVAQTMNVSFNQLNGKAITEDHSFRIYTSLLKSRSDYDFSKFKFPTFSHSTLCCYVLLEPQDTNLGNFVRIYHNSGGNTPFRLKARSNDIQFSFRGDLLKDLETAVSTATGLPATFCSIG
jgi:hypothetical protein